MNYQRYIHSEEWREKSEQIIATRGGVCETCGRSEFLGVHHLNYETLGHERDEDVKVLCIQHHSMKHSGKLIRHGRAGCISAAFDADAVHRELLVVLHCFTGVRARKQILQLVQYSGATPDLVVHSEVLDLFSSRDRAMFMNAISNEVSYMAIDAAILQMTGQLPVDDVWTMHQREVMREDRKETERMTASVGT